MKRILKILALCTVAAIAGALATLILHLLHTPLLPAAEDIKYTDFLSITLTALSLMITVLGIFVAAAGVIGWTTLESKLRLHSVEYFSKQLEKDAPLRKEFEQFFADIAYTGIEGLKNPGNEESPYSD
ncbi:hypothetical protein [Sphingomonas taxi]|uniref:hypothetical protein n=1 Tax=Sphingomonas taxi TaxID=1549858 RepID=UPI0012E0715C|nr:hypothetical protein [Sphingomonas taxi]